MRGVFFNRFVSQFEIMHQQLHLANSGHRGEELRKTIEKFIGDARAVLGQTPALELVVPAPLIINVEKSSGIDPGFAYHISTALSSHEICCGFTALGATSGPIKCVLVRADELRKWTASFVDHLAREELSNLSEGWFAVPRFFYAVSPQTGRGVLHGPVETVLRQRLNSHGFDVDLDSTRLDKPSDPRLSIRIFKIRRASPFGDFG